MTNQTTPLVLDRRVFKTCHIILPDSSKPIAGIFYDNALYSYVKFYRTLEAAQRAVERSMQLGNLAVLTRTPKGFVLWVLEADAQLAQ